MGEPFLREQRVRPRITCTRKHLKKVIVKQILDEKRGLAIGQPEILVACSVHFSSIVILDEKQ